MIELPNEGDAPSYDIGGMKEEIDAYMGVLDKYNQPILQGRPPWDKLEEMEWHTGAKDYLKELHGNDASTVYNALKNTGDVTTFMSFGLKQKYGSEGVDALMDEYANQTRDAFDKLSGKVRDAGMESFAETFTGIGDGLAKVYEHQPSGYLFAEGLLHISDQAGNIAKSIEQSADKFSGELEKLTNLIDKLNERYGDLE
ncbi:MAG: hypothetical protein QGG26_06965 [Candidatus Undinarchaeales archaeon]|jgi:hypothetical protein|nr:hypothetical protein [Candidatus Undinarchaeales archaeon]